MTIDPVIERTLTFSFMLLFAAAASHKVRDLRAFRATLDAYRLVSSVLVAPMAALVVAVEIAIASTIWFAWQAGLAAALLLAVYAAAIGINLARGRTDIDCGCSGTAARTTLSGWLVVRNLVLVAMALGLSLPASHETRPLVWVDGLTIAGATAALAACWLASERMLMLVPVIVRVRGAG